MYLMARFYCGAGIIPVNGDYMLVMLETRKDAICPSYIDIGGKKELNDRSCWETALREFSEEAPGLPLPEKSRIKGKAWNKRGKYACFFVHYPAIPAPEGFKWVKSLDELDKPAHKRLLGILRR